MALLTAMRLSATPIHPGKPFVGGRERVNFVIDETTRAQDSGPTASRAPIPQRRASAADLDDDHRPAATVDRWLRATPRRRYDGAVARRSRGPGTSMPLSRGGR